MLTLGTDNPRVHRPRHSPRTLRARVAHRRGGYRDPESQAFIKSWFRYAKRTMLLAPQPETLDQAREVINAYINHYHHRPHSQLNYRTPSAVHQTWDDAQDQLQKLAA